MTKADLMTAFSEKLAEEVRVLEAVLGDSVENATGDETKSEGKYDTRATEAAYLAEGQRARLEGLRETRHYFGSLILKAFVATEEVGAGALVEIEDAVGNLTFYLLLKKGGGLSAEFLGCEAMVITPESRVYGELIGQRLGDPVGSDGWKIMGIE